ncbi:MAG: hypothetical protein KA073_01085 [Aliarcobacter sp.]|nr:hypothetical protein [Aliarcobacter sp.]
MKKQLIKFINRSSTNENKSKYEAQLPGEENELDICKFNFDASLKDYDWLVVVDDIPRVISKRIENLSSPKENTILITTEPNSITKYGKAFAGQFKYLITNQDEKSLPHPNAIRSQTGNIWFYGKTLNEINISEKPIKTKKISTVCSNKQQGHTIHKLRFEFTKIMEEKISEVERFGKGFKWIETKAEAIDDYEFHVAIENHYAPHVWTEKLADAFLGYSVPIYYGCPNIYDYFHEESIILIDIYDIDNSIKKIKEIINTPGEYERRLPFIIEARKKIIEEYNLFSIINKIVKENSNEKKSERSLKNKIYNRRIMRAKNFSDLFVFFLWKIKNFFRNL